MRKHILAAALTAALAIPAALAADQAKPGDQPTTSEKVSDAASDAWSWLKKESKAAWDSASKAFTAAIEMPRRKIIIGTDLPTAISGKRLLGTPIENAREGKVGSISDIVFASDAHLAAVVVAQGGFLGIGAEHVPLKPQLITIRRQIDGSFKARTNVSDAQLDRAGDAAFVTNIEAMGDNYKKPENRRLAALIGASVVGPSGDKVASVDDVLLSPTGDASYAILAIGPLGAGNRVAVSFSSLRFTRSDEPLKTARTAADLEKLASIQ